MIRTLPLGRLVAAAFVAVLVASSAAEARSSWAAKAGRARRCCYGKSVANVNATSAALGKATELARQAEAKYASGDASNAVKLLVAALRTGNESTASLSRLSDFSQVAGQQSRFVCCSALGDLRMSAPMPRTSTPKGKGR